VSDLDLLAGAVAGVVAGGLGALVPLLVARIPEPEPEEPLEGEEPAEPEEPEEKELYAHIAASPGLAWKSAAAGLVSGAAIGAVVGLEWPLLYLVPLVPVGVALAVVDWRTRRLPTKVIAPTYYALIAVLLLLGAVTRDGDDLVRAALGWLIAGGLYGLLWFIYPRGMGYGDVRLSGVLGLALGYLGWSELMVGIYGGFLLGGVLGGLLAALRRVDRRGYPFGPFMLLGAVVGVLVGQPITDALYN